MISNSPYLGENQPHNLEATKEHLREQLSDLTKRIESLHVDKDQKEILNKKNRVLIAKIIRFKNGSYYQEIKDGIAKLAKEIKEIKELENPKEEPKPAAISTIAHVNPMDRSQLNYGLSENQEKETKPTPVINPVQDTHGNSSSATIPAPVINSAQHTHEYTSSATVMYAMPSLTPPPVLLRTDKPTRSTCCSLLAFFGFNQRKIVKEESKPLLDKKKESLSIPSVSKQPSTIKSFFLSLFSCCSGRSHKPKNSDKNLEDGREFIERKTYKF